MSKKAEELAKFADLFRGAAEDFRQLPRRSIPVGHLPFEILRKKIRCGRLLAEVIRAGVFSEDRHSVNRLSYINSQGLSEDADESTLHFLWNTAYRSWMLREFASHFDHRVIELESNPGIRNEEGQVIDRAGIPIVEGGDANNVARHFDGATDEELAYFQETRAINHARACDLVAGLIQQYADEESQKEAAASAPASAAEARDGWVTNGEAALMSGLSRTTITRLCQKGKLRSAGEKRNRRIDLKSLAIYLKREGEEAPAEESSEKVERKMKRAGL